MKIKLLLLAIFSFLAIPLVSANLAVPITLLTAPLFPLIVIIESFLFWLLAKNWLKTQCGFWKSLLLVSLANLITSLLGTVIPFVTLNYWENSAILSLAFVLSIFIEWGMFIFMLKYIRFLRLNITKKNLLLLSVYLNIASYVPLIIIFGGY